MKRSEKMQTERKGQNPTVTGSKGRNPWNDTEDEETEFSDVEDQAPNETDLPEYKGSTRLLTIIQIVACTAALAAAVALRLNGGAVYQNVKSWYFESLNNSIVADSQMDNVKHVVINLWSTITSSRADSSQEPSGSSSQTSSFVPENGAASGTSSQNNASASAPSGSQLPDNASASKPSGSSPQNNVSNGGIVSSSVSP